MKPGKISEPVLKRSVIRTIKYITDEIPAKAAPGNDAVIADSEGIVAAVSTAGLYMSEENLFFDCKCAILNGMNNIAAKGGRPFAVLMNIILPAGKLESDLRALTGSISRLCLRLKLQIAGGSTEVSVAVKSTIVSFTVLGHPAVVEESFESEGLENKYLYTEPAAVCRPGMDIVLTKRIGIMGTVMMLYEKRDELLTKFPESYLEKALEAEEEMSVCSEAAVAGGSGAAVMHDVSRGGIFAALWELAEITGRGVEAVIADIPVRQETIELCEFYGLNPYKLISGGSLLLVCSHGNDITDRLRRRGISATVIGKLTENNDKVVIQNGEKRYLEPPKGDEIYKVIGNKKR
ncbi:MAG: hydrogenase maturation factor [Lachnospiraceae bacterium]|nr:hydrogenase maturation factor [Lachnospiraceae bacterium]